MIIQSTKQLNSIVAQSLGWLEVEFQGNTLVDGKTALSTIKYYCPQTTEESQRLEFYRHYGECPNFVVSWQHTQIIFDECDRQDLLVEVVRSKEAISCTIRPSNPNEWEAANFKPVTVGFDLPRSMSLAIVLGWLNFKGYNFEKIELC